ncbi:hypothetical protein NW072_05670 [Mycoplasmopsis felis]|uniref:hypothetical protein n=1 Tax=Mycoplasmopsis felis TaxID=33923 RepID=UPI0021B08817|nr:hypothetical protein [Mycoplasmopsis felis]UWV79477.1 hypothetical protein NW072_05670 [Mycoplasmopsis felis]
MLSSIVNKFFNSWLLTSDSIVFVSCLVQLADKTNTYVIDITEFKNIAFFILDIITPI